MRKILLLNNTTDHSNWGSQATGYALQQIFKSTLTDFEINPAYSKWVVERYFQRPSFLGSSVVTQLKGTIDRYTKRINFIPTVADEFEEYAEYWQKNKDLRPIKETIELLEANDDIVFNAEGSVYRNNYSAQRCLFTLWYAKHVLNKRTYFLNGMANLTDVDSMMNAYVRRVFESCDGIAIREPYSIRSLEHYNIKGNYTLAPDAVFYYANNYDAKANTTDQYHKLKDELKGKDYFCFSLSMLPVDYKFNPNKSALIELIKEMKKVIPTAVIMAKDGSDQFLQDLAKRTDSIFFGQEYNHHDLFEVLADAKVLLSGRYHHVMMAAIVGCPSVTFTTTSHKMQGLVELIGNKLNFPYDATYIRPSIKKIAEEAVSMANNSTLRGELKTISKKLGEDALKMGQMLKLN